MCTVLLLSLLGGGSLSPFLAFQFVPIAVVVWGAPLVWGLLLWVTEPVWAQLHRKLNAISPPPKGCLPWMLFGLGPNTEHAREFCLGVWGWLPGASRGTQGLGHALGI